MTTGSPVAPASLIGQVRRRLAVGDDLDVDGAVRNAVRAEAGGIADDAVLGSVRRAVTAELVGAGPLEPLLALPGVSDVLVTAPDRVWIDRGEGVELTAVRFPDDEDVRRLGQRLVAAAGRRLDDACPYADATLPDGTRLHVVLPPLTRATTLSLRVIARRPLAMTDLVAAGTLSAALADLLCAAVTARLGVLISGGTGAGKTTLLAALLGTVGAGERLVVVEDAAELAITHPHVVRLVTRVANVEGAGEVGLRDLVRQALRMRPDRLVVGEFRGPEMIELLVALNTGHDGGAATVHANSAADVPDRLTVLGMLGGLPADAVAGLAAGGLHLVVHLRRTAGRRQVAEVALLHRQGGGLAVLPVWSARGGDEPADAPGPARLRALLRRFR